METNKSPIVEYLKQVEKDRLLPHFLPFKRLEEATSSAGGTGLKYSLDSFSINTRVAPSIASAIMNMKNLRSMSLIDTMLHEEAFLIILETTPRTLTSLNLSNNEHLTAKCYSVLHKFDSLAHLTLEKCNINDEILNLLLDLDPLGLSPEPIKVIKGSLSPTKRGTTSAKGLRKLKSKLSSSFGAITEVDEEPEFTLSGLVTSLRLFNASKNRISDVGAGLLARFLEKSDMLETLLMHWNKIRGKGAI